MTEPAYRVVVPWPSYPRLTVTGAESHARRAGHLVPWLSTNRVNNLPAPIYRDAKIRWKEATDRAILGFPPLISVEIPQLAGPRPHMIYATLYKATAQLMDPLAVAEGLKPIIDALVYRGIIADDDESWIRGVVARSRKAQDRAHVCLDLALVATGSPR